MIHVSELKTDNGYLGRTRSNCAKNADRFAPTIARAMTIYDKYARPCITLNNGPISFRKLIIAVIVIASKITITTPPLIYGLCTTSMQTDV
jgi:hypothetical protein